MIFTTIVVLWAVKAWSSFGQVKINLSIMKKTITFIFTFCLFSLSIAQPVLYRDSLRTGLSFNLYTLTNVNTTNLRSLGPNVVWDLSGTSSVLLGTVDFQEMSATPYALQYPAANFAMKFTVGSNVFYSLFRLSDSTMDEVGNNVSTSGGVPFTDYRTALVFPFTYNLTHSDNYQKTGQGMKTIKLKYDAYGSFVTGLGTSNNVMRIMTVDNGDTAVNFWGSSPCVPVFTSSINSNNFTYWKQNPPLGVDRISMQNNISIFPNPGGDMLNMSGAKEVLGVKIYNISGQFLMDVPSENIDISMLTEGLYLVKINTSSGTVIRKLIKS